MPKTRDLRDPALYLNRELSQLAFNFRVLAQAMDDRVPLLERLRYLCISCTNLDEFFEIRVAAVRHQLEYGGPPAADGLAPAAALLADCAAQHAPALSVRLLDVMEDLVGLRCSECRRVYELHVHTFETHQR